MSRVRRIVLLVFFLIGLMFPGQERVVSAQDEHWEIRIHQISTLEGPDAMNLKTYFSIYDDKSGTPMLNVDAQTAQITLLNTNYTSNGELKKPDIPIYITLLLDASGSMARAAESIQKAAKLSLNDTPDNAFFSVVSSRTRRDSLRN